MWTLLDIVAEKSLAITARTAGQIHASSAANHHSNRDRFEVSIHNWDGGVDKSWWGEDPRALLDEALAHTRLKDPGGTAKLSLVDRWGGETVHVTNVSHGESASLLDLISLTEARSQDRTTDEDSVRAMFSSER